MLAYHFLLSYPFFNLFRISPCTEKDRFWAPTQRHVTVRVLHSSITSLRSALHHGLSYHTRKCDVEVFFKRVF